MMKFIYFKQSKILQYYYFVIFVLPTLATKLRVSRVLNCKALDVMCLTLTLFLEHPGYCSITCYNITSRIFDLTCQVLAEFD